MAYASARADKARENNIWKNYMADSVRALAMSQHIQQRYSEMIVPKSPYTVDSVLSELQSRGGIEVI